MSKSTITTAGIDPDLYVLGSTQQFNYNQNSSFFRLNNIFTPTGLVSSQTSLEFRNNLLSGFRFIHLTSNTDTYGSLTLQSFVNASPTGTNLITFNSTGIVISSLYVASTSMPSTPATANDGIYSVSSGKPIFTSGTTNYQGALITAKDTLTSGIGTLNGTTGVTITTAAISTTSIVNITRNNGAASGAPANTGNLSVGNITNGGSFTVYSSNVSDNSHFSWQIINP